MRGATRRAWIKLYITGMLHGSVRWQLEPDERSVWIDLLLLAGECSKNGKVVDNDGKPYPPQYIASHFNISSELLERTLRKCKEQKRISLENGIMTIRNWAAYQSEYERQRLSRERAALPMSEREKVGMTRSLVNQRPEVAIDVLSRDFGYKVDKE